VVWWLAKNDERIDKAVSDIGLLAELASAAHDQPVPVGFHRFVPGLSAGASTDDDQETEPTRTAPRTPDEYVDLLVEFLGLPEEDPRLVLFLKRVADDAEGAGQPEVAEALRRRLDHFSTGRHTAPDEPYGAEPPDGESPPSGNEDGDDNGF
jgi:hypothetical protein